MRVLHAVALLQPSSGVVNQMRWEQRAAGELGLDWESTIFTTSTSSYKPTLFKVIRKLIDSLPLGRLKNVFDLISLRRNYYKWLKSRENLFDIYVLRHSLYDIQQLIFIMQTNRPVYLVHHTLELSELALQIGWLGKVKVLLELWVGRHSIKSAYATVGVTQEIIDYEKRRANQPNKRSILYPNGVMCYGFSLTDRREAIPEIIFVASCFHPWHGLDLLLETMRENNDSFILHLVGELSPMEEAAARDDSRIIVHGHKDAISIGKIAESCWIGLSSFAIFRTGTQEACTLKVREYLAMGLPVYSGHRDVFPADFKYYKNSTLSIINILKFAFACRNITREEVASESFQYIDKVELLRHFSEQLIL
jgi:glycosyltransferase involved in cell wall biosynthesis